MIESKRTPYRVILVTTPNDGAKLTEALQWAINSTQAAMGSVAQNWANSEDDKENMDRLCAYRSALHDILSIVQPHPSETRK